MSMDELDTSALGRNGGPGSSSGASSRAMSASIVPPTDFYYQNLQTQNPMMQALLAMQNGMGNGIGGGLGMGMPHPSLMSPMTATLPDAGDSTHERRMRQLEQGAIETKSSLGTLNNTCNRINDTLAEISAALQMLANLQPAPGAPAPALAPVPAAAAPDHRPAVYDEMQIPVLRPSPLKTDLPNITYYTKASWEKALKAMGNDSAESVCGRKWGFLQQADGTPVPLSVLQAMWAMARDFFTTMSQHVRVMPSKWKSKFSLYWRHLFIQTMENGFEAFRHGENHWKTIKFGGIQLSSFKKTRKELFEDSDSDSADEAADERSKSKTLGKRRAVDPPAQRRKKVFVVNDSDDEDVPRPKASTKRRTDGRHLGTVNLVDSGEEEELVPQAPKPKPKPRLPDPFADICYKTARPALAVSAGTGSVSSSVSSSGSGSGSSSGSGSGSGSSPSDVDKPPSAEGTSGSAPVSAEEEEEELPADPTPESEDIPGGDPELEDDHRPDSTGSTTAETPSGREEQAGATTGGRATKKGSKQPKQKKGDAIFEADDKQTARGAAGRAWKKDHPDGTVKQFQAWWTLLDADEKERYKETAKNEKQASKKAVK